MIRMVCLPICNDFLYFIIFPSRIKKSSFVPTIDKCTTFDCQKSDFPVFFSKSHNSAGQRICRYTGIIRKQGWSVHSGECRRNIQNTKPDFLSLIPVDDVINSESDLSPDPARSQGFALRLREPLGSSAEQTEGLQPSRQICESARGGESYLPTHRSLFRQFTGKRFIVA